MIGGKPKVSRITWALPKQWLLAFVVVASTMIFTNGSAHAQGLADPRGGEVSYSQAIGAVQTGACASGPGSMVSDCDCYPGLTNRVVGCIRQTLHNASAKYFNPNTGMHSIVATAITAMITLGVAIYGAMLAAGMVEKLNRDTFTLLIKIALVSYFVVNTQMLYELFLNIIDALATDMFQFSSTGLLGICMTKFSIWERMDCMLDSVIGIQVSAITSSSFQGFNQNLAGDMMQRGMMGVFFQILKSSSFGFVIGLMGFLFIYSMLFFLVRVLFAFLMSFIALTFLMMIGPIFIPMVIFRVTKQYFDKWVRLIISSCLQPIILVAFITFATAGLDLVMFSGPTSVIRVIAGDAATQPNFSLHAYINQFLVKSTFKAPSRVGESSAKDFEQTVGLVKSFVQVNSNDCLRNPVGFVTPGTRPGDVPTVQPQQGVNRLVECAKSQVAQLPYEAIDLPRLAAARTPAVDADAANIVLTVNPDTEEKAKQVKEARAILGQKMTQELFASVAIAVTMMFLMHTLMKVVPMISNDLTGEFRYTPSFFGGRSGLAGNLSKQVSSAMQSNMKGGG